MLSYYRHTRIKCNLFNKRQLHTLSRFHNSSHILTTHDKQLNSNENTMHNIPRREINENTTANLEDLIIEKLKHLKLDKSPESNDDLNILLKKHSPQSKLTEIDEYILKQANVMIESQSHIQMDYLNLLNDTEHKSMKNNTMYNYKYPLISSNDSLPDIQTLQKFVNRITSHNFLNSNDKVKRFLVQRLINDPQNQDFLRQYTDLIYPIMEYFLRKFRPSYLMTIDKILKFADVNDIKMMNLILKYSTNCNLPLNGKLMTLNRMLDFLNSNKIQLNKTTIYLIFKYFDETEISSTGRLTRFLMEYMERENLLNDKHITDILFERLSVRYIKYHKIESEVIKDSIEKEMVAIIKLIPKFSPVEVSGKVTTSVIRKLFSISKFNQISTFIKVFKVHLFENNWKFVWDNINAHQLFVDDKLPNIERKRLLSMYSSLRFSNCGKSIPKSSKLIKSLWGREICNYAVRTENWQLLIRLLNELQQTNAKVYKNALNSLLTLNIEESFLNPTQYLILVKYLLNKSLTNELWIFERNDVIFKELQLKVDSMFNTKFSSYNYFMWQDKINLARVKYENNRNIKYKLLDKCFITESESHQTSTMLIDDDDDISDHRIIQDDDITRLLSPNLSIITEFESKLFDRLSRLKILDTEDKVENEYNAYSGFWDKRGIKLADVKRNYYLGIINANYKKDYIQWTPKNSTLSEDHPTKDTRNEKTINEIHNLDHQGLVDIFNANPDYEIFVGKNDRKRLQKTKQGSLNNVLPTDWLEFVLTDTHQEWLAESIMSNHSKHGSSDTNNPTLL